MDRVITYRLAYLDREVTLCAQCADSDAHGCGVLGPVQRGAHRGECEGDTHDSRAGAAVIIRVPHARDAYLTVRA